MAPAPDHNRAIGFYRELVRIRTFEERVGELFVRGGTAGSMLHLSIGEEAAAVGVGAAMRDGDTFTTHHRGHGVFLARGADPKAMMAEIAGKAEGYCRGKGGSMHIADMGLGHLGANAIVGGGIPAVVGAGLSSQMLGQGRVSVAFFGDGALQQGILYEAMNLAALWALPVVFVAINNQYGMGTRIDQASAVLDFAGRARSFGLAAEAADGTDVDGVYTAANRLLDGARAGIPAFLIVDCYRFHGHARMDKSPYRAADEETAGRQRDPVARQAARLIDTGLADDAGLAAIRAAAATEMDAAIDVALAGTAPGADALFTDVYAPDTPPPEPVDTRLARILGA